MTRCLLSSFPSAHKTQISTPAFPANMTIVTHKNLFPVIASSRSLPKWLQTDFEPDPSFRPAFTAVPLHVSRVCDPVFLDGGYKKKSQEMSLETSLLYHLGSNAPYRNSHLPQSDPDQSQSFEVEHDQTCERTNTMGRKLGQPL